MKFDGLLERKIWLFKMQNMKILWLCMIKSYLMMIGIL